MNKPLHVLFVCGRNNRRSPTAEKIYLHDRRMEVRSRGLADTSRQRLTDEDMTWADLVLAMERKHVKRMLVEFGHIEPLPPIENLDISDNYTFMNKALIREITEAVEAVLEEHGVT